ncbi:hypothetical protein I6G97_00495 [Edwardsiella hoshinae]|nr:hypothetical protein I6G97_00495 [Edwardsiella hoshinae]
MLENSFYRLLYLIVSCIILFLFLDIIAMLVASLIVFFKTGAFIFRWEGVFASFLSSGYVGGIILGVGLWVKIWLQERRNK